MTIPPRKFDLKFLRKEKASKDAYSFYFQRGDLDFLAGQAMRFTLQNIENPDNRGNSRFFSICTSPLEKEEIMITTRIIQSAFKMTLSNIPEGTIVSAFGPTGNYTLDEEKTNPLVFIAGGIGITPIRSIITYAIEKKLSMPITLFTSFRTKEDIVFRETFKKCEEEKNNFKMIETLTEAEEGIEWDGYMGRINEQMLRENIKDIPSSIFYISGPEVMVDALKQVVRSLDVAEESIKAEIFPGY